MQIHSTGNDPVSDFITSLWKKETPVVTFQSGTVNRVVGQLTRVVWVAVVALVSIELSSFSFPVCIELKNGFPIRFPDLYLLFELTGETLQRKNRSLRSGTSSATSLRQISIVDSLRK